MKGNRSIALFVQTSQVPRTVLRVIAATFLALSGCSELARTSQSLTGYSERDQGPFNPSSAIYFMDGASSAKVRILSTGEELGFDFGDRNTSISASAPLLSRNRGEDSSVYLAAPEPLPAVGYFPTEVPKAFHEASAIQLLQVISMNMRSSDGKAALLIGLPYAEKYPELFFKKGLFNSRGPDAASYGVVASLTDYPERGEGAPVNGYPARSVFAVFHILETPMGVFFNKKPTVMELQPARDGKLALTLPPIPFRYELVNGPIPLYDVRNADGPPVAEVVAADHHDGGPAKSVTPRAWPWHKPDLDAIRERLH
jgi:hypothetical protein